MTTQTAHHTPGPWTYSFESVDPEWAIVTIEGGLIIANVNAHYRQEANARLITAAPEMLDVLRKIGLIELGRLMLKAAALKQRGIVEAGRARPRQVPPVRPVLEEMGKIVGCPVEPVQ